jgi:hypothetical protein
MDYNFITIDVINSYNRRNVIMQIYFLLLQQLIKLPSPITEPIIANIRGIVYIYVYIFLLFYFWLF